MGFLALALASALSPTLTLTVNHPNSTPKVGFLHGAIKSVDDARVGDTITLASEPHPDGALPGYAEPVPMVYCGLFPVETTQYQLLRESLERLRYASVRARDRVSAIPYGCSPCRPGLQPPPFGIAASVAQGCSLHYLRLQAQ